MSNLNWNVTFKIFLSSNNSSSKLENVMFSFRATTSKTTLTSLSLDSYKIAVVCYVNLDRAIVNSESIPK